MDTLLYISISLGAVLVIAFALIHLVPRFLFSAPVHYNAADPLFSSVLVTGASRGIGKRCAIDLLRRGYRVYAGVRRKSDGDRLVAEATGILSMTKNQKLIPVILDVTSDDSVAEAVARVAADLASDDRCSLCALVNNAGVNVGPYPVEYVPLDKLRFQLDVNVIGQVRVTRGFLPLLRKCPEGGRVVLMSSVAGSISAAFSGTYAASKFALEALGDALRRELVPWKMSVSIVKPAELQSDLLDAYQKDAETVMKSMDDTGRRLYGQFYDNMKPTRGKYVGDVGMASKAVLHAVSSPRPKSRYVVGAKAMLSAHIFPFSFLGIKMPVWSLLPDRYFDKQMRRVWPKRYKVPKE